MAKDFENARHPIFVDRATLSRIFWNEVQIVEHFHSWDGPLNGLVEYRGRIWWFEYCGGFEDCTNQMVCDCPDYLMRYVYLVYPLTEQQIDEFRRRIQPNDGYVGPMLDGAYPVGWFIEPHIPSYLRRLTYRPDH